MVNTVDLLTKVTKSVVIHGFDFTEALEHTLKQCSMLGKHSGIIHFTPHCITRYIWAHKDYQPWGQRLPLQCSQCGILNPWTIAYLKEQQCYGVECKNLSCGVIGGRTLYECHSFTVAHPDGSTLLSVGKDYGWLKATVK